MVPEMALTKDRKFENRRRRVLDRLYRQRWEIESKAIKTADRISGRIVDVSEALKRRRFVVIQRINRGESMRGPANVDG